MKRRDFFRRIGVLAAGFSVLPAATTFVRNKLNSSPGWGVTKIRYVLNPEWVKAPFEVEIIYASKLDKVVPIVFKRQSLKSDSANDRHREKNPKWVSPGSRFSHERPSPDAQWRKMPVTWPVRLRLDGTMVFPFVPHSTFEAALS